MDNTLTVKLLPAPLICENFVQGIDFCNYECYLLEIINASKYFRDKSKGKKYRAPLSEAHGEYDCVSDNYSLDFKLVGGKTALQARSLFSMGIHQIDKGVRAYCAPKKRSSDSDYKPIKVTRIFAILRSMSMEELKVTRYSKNRKQGIDTDIKSFLKTLETKKNILMFFPYEFFSETDNNFSIVISNIIESLNKDFSISLEYRKEVAPEFDTYFIFLYDGFFVLLKENRGKLEILDKVKETASPVYLKLKSYTA